MNTEIKVIIERIKMVSSGEPCFGKGMYTLLDEVNTKHAHTRPCNTEHTRQTCSIISLPGPTIRCSV